MKTVDSHVKCQFHHMPFEDSYAFFSDVDIVVWCYQTDKWKFKGLVHQKFKFYTFASHHFVDSASGDIF